MKILIGTPIHEIKDYSMERWLKNVANLTKKTPADLFMVDNSPTLDYMEKVKGYCKNYGIKNYKITHLNFDQGMDVDKKDERIEASEEIIVKKVISGEYDAWFSWECDELLPTDALSKLIKIMCEENFMMVVHNAWARKNPEEDNPDMGITLIKRVYLEKYGSLIKRTTYPGQGREKWFKGRVLRAGGEYIDVYGVISPIYHLDK